MVNDTYGTEDCKGYHDYRELLARDDIDAVMIAVPDHWHEIVATEAARRKKDIYAEKPLAHTIAEQQSIVRAVEQNNIIWQMGSWQRSVPTFHKAAEIVRNGLIGSVTHVEVGLPGGNSDFDGVQKEALAKLAAQGITVIQPGAGLAWHQGLGSAGHRSSVGTGLRDMDRPIEDGAVHQAALCINPGAGITTPAAASFWTGSAIIATSRTGVWISTILVRRRWKAAASCRRQTRFGTPRPSTGLS